MYQSIFRAVERGATVLTGGKHLARALHESYTGYQRDRGQSLWETPDILMWNAFLERCWHYWLLSGSAQPAPLLLNAAQEQAVWESVILEAPQGRTLLRVPETARRAMEAWHLVQAYKLPFRAGEFSVSGDCEAFFQWACAFEAKRDANGWLELARLSGRIEALLREGAIERPPSVLPAGFDELTPRQRDLLDALAGQFPPVPEVPGPGALVLPRADTNEEIRSAAMWARTKLEENAQARIGIAVPDLETLRPKLERIFGEVLHPGQALESRSKAFHLSLGAPLSEHPIAHAALLILKLVSGPISIERAGLLLRSPFLKGGKEEQSSRAGLDGFLRRDAPPRLSLHRLREFAGHCPILDKALGGLDRELQKFPPEQYASAWSRACSKLLQAAGWPGDSAPNSYESQVAEAWNQLLSTLATLDAVTGRMPLSEAIARLRTLAANTNFEPQDQGAAVQIFGWESSGLSFDHLWVMGLHDEAIPARARPNPFLPIALQREYRLPHASAAWELALAAKIIARCQAGAPDVVLSYPEWEGDRPLGPSPLIAAVPRGAAVDESPVWMDLIRAAAALESVEDAQAPELPLGSLQLGGTRMLQAMAACPFRAYAEHRLGARPLKEAAFALDYLERGTAVHLALELVWAELKSHRELCARTPVQLSRLVAECVAKALDKTGSLGASLERRRLEPLLAEWLEMERARPPFVVLEREEKHEIEIGGLRIHTRIDRVDELADGSRAVIDYKTGQIKSGVWLGDRPDEPQVPLYCATTGHNVAAAAFAQVRKGKLQFIGVAENQELGEIKPVKELNGRCLPGIIDDWSRVLHKLGGDFRLGRAVVDPKRKSTCDFCRLTPLCRVRDVQRDG